jgi:tape measure domain-containing protein
MAGKEYRLSIIVTGRDAGASSMLGGIGNSLRSIGTIAGGILTSQLFMSIGRGIGNMAREAIGATGEIQKMNMMLTTLQARELIKSGDFTDMNEALKASAPLAAATMKELERIAVLSPYQLENVNSTYRLAMAFGYTSKEATKFTQATLNMAAGIGAEGEMLDRMSYNLAQVRLQGKVTALDMRQLAMAGFDLGDVLKYVGKQMGVNVEDHNDFNKAIAEGKITWEDFTNHYAEYAEKNFGGASERMSRTLVGLKSTFKDVFALSMPKILGPAVEVVTGYLNGLLDKFIGLRDSGALEAVGEKLGIFAENAIKTVDKLLVWFDKGRWGKIAEFFGGGFVDLTASFRDSIDNVNWGELSDRLISGIQSINWEKLGLNVREGFRNIFEGLGIVADEVDWEGIFSSAGTGFMDFMGGLTATGDFETFKETWAFNITSAMEFVKNRLVQEAAAMGGILTLAMTSPFASLGASVGGLLGGMVYMMRAKAVEMAASFTSQFTAMGANLSAIFQQKRAEVIASLSSWVSDLARIGMMIVNAFTSPFTNIGGTLRSALNSAMGGIVASLSAWVGQINAVLSQIGSGLSGLMGGGLGGILGGSSEKPKPKPNNPFGSSGLSGGMQSFSGGGIATGPLSGYQALLHGTEAVIPLSGGGIPVQLLPSQAGGGNINIQLVYAPGISTASRREFEDELAPFVREGVRSEFQKRGL